MNAKNDKLIAHILNDPDFRIQKNGVLEKITRYRDMKLGKGQKKPVWKSVGFISSSGLKVVLYKKSYLQIKRISWAKHKGALRSNKSIKVKDGNESNCAPENLESIDFSEIKITFYRAGRKATNARLTWNQVIDLKKDWNTGNYTQKKLGEKYGISQMAASYIVNNKTYKNKINHEEEN